MKDDKKIIFTHHADERLKQFNLTRSEAVQMIREGDREKPPKGSKEENDQAEHYRYGTFLFTGRHKADDIRKVPIFLVITLFDQRLYLK